MRFGKHGPVYIFFEKCIAAKVNNKLWFKMLDSFKHLVETWTIMGQVVDAVLAYTGKAAPIAAWLFMLFFPNSVS